MTSGSDANRLRNLSRTALLKEKMFLEGLLFAKPADEKLRDKHDSLMEEMKRRKIKIVD